MFIFGEAFSFSEFDDKDSSDDEYSSVYTRSLLASKSLNISSTALYLFSAHVFSESNCSLKILTLCLSILAAFIVTIKSGFIVSSSFLDLFCIPGIFDFS